jgi:RimJ/RimL family protein N-acetyltransferase
MSALQRPAGGWLLRRWRRTFARIDDKRHFCLGIYDKTDDRLLGYHTVALQDSVAFVGVVVGERAWWGRGVVVETRAELVRFLFETMGVARVWGTPFARNFASIYNYQRLGFAYEGALRRHRSAPDGGRADLAIFGLLREEWLASQARPAAPPLRARP